MIVRGAYAGIRSRRCLGYVLPCKRGSETKIGKLATQRKGIFTPHLSRVQASVHSMYLYKDPNINLKDERTYWYLPEI